MSTSVPYRADIDGLRAIAVLAVVLFHAKVGPFTGGYVGVDVFFVISGFLITSIIVNEMKAGTFSFANFYERRVRRIFPALFIVVLACLAAGWFILTPNDYREFGLSMVFMGAFISNVFFKRHAGYFGPAAETQPLLHTWSLAVEEQFYAIAPIALLGLYLYAWKNRAVVLGLLAFASLASAAYGVSQEWPSAFYLLHSRAWELMTGMALALGIVPAVTRRPLAEALGLAGLAMILWTVAMYSPSTPFPGVAALLPCLGTAFIIHSGASVSTFAARFLATPPIVFTGKISYSLYLWHWPLLAFAAYEWGTEFGTRERLALIALAGALSVLTWAAIEQPARRKSGFLTQRRVLALGLAAMLACVCIGKAIKKTDGIIARLPADLQIIARQASNRSTPGDACGRGEGPEDLAGTCPLGTTDARPTKFLLWGDSHATAIADEVSRIAKDKALRGVLLTGGGCAPLLGLEKLAPVEFSKCIGRHAPITGLLANPDIRDIIITARWAAYSEGKGVDGGVVTRVRKFAETGVDANRDEFFRLLRETIKTLLYGGRRITIIGPVPELPRNLPTTLIKDKMRGQVRDYALAREDFVKRQFNMRPMLESLGMLHGVRVIYPEDTLCSPTTCATIVDGELLYSDDNHLNRAGAKRLHALLEEVMAPIGQP